MTRSSTMAHGGSFARRYSSASCPSIASTGSYPSRRSRSASASNNAQSSSTTSTFGIAVPIVEAGAELPPGAVADGTHSIEAANQAPDTPRSRRAPVRKHYVAREETGQEKARVAGAARALSSPEAGRRRPVHPRDHREAARGQSRYVVAAARGGTRG